MSQPLKLLPPVWKSDAGRARPNNEDWAEYETPRDPDLLAQKGILLVVADGAGGHERGQEASRTAVKTVISTYYGDASPDVAASLVHAFKVANAEVFQLSARSSGDKNAMTTLVAAVIRGNELYVAHVGDSRAYLVRGNTIQQLTQDHSWVAEQKRAGVLTEEQARRHPQRSLITRAIGADRDVQVDTNRFTLRPGDAVVLCTDGLTGQMSDEEIKNYVTTQPPREAAQRMIDEVNRRGGFDNITVLIAKTQQTQAMPARSGSPVVRLVGALAVLLAVGLLAVGVWGFVKKKFPSSSPTQVAHAVATTTPSGIVTTPQSTQPSRPAASATTGTQTAGPGPAREPTATLRPVASSTQTPSWTPAVTMTPSPISVAPGTIQQTGKYPEPELISPEEGDSPIGSVVFRWKWAGTLKTNERFDLHVWRKDTPETSVGHFRETTHRMDRPPNGAGKYRWRVLVIQEQPGGKIAIVSEVPTPITLDFWRGKEQVTSTATPSPVPTPHPTESPEPTETPNPTATPAPPGEGTPNPIPYPMSLQEGPKHATIFSHSTGTNSSAKSRPDRQQSAIYGYRCSDHVKTGVAAPARR